MRLVLLDIFRPLADLRLGCRRTSRLERIGNDQTLGSGQHFDRHIIAEL